jgi:hypothetical protein
MHARRTRRHLSEPVVWILMPLARLPPDCSPCLLSQVLNFLHPLQGQRQLNRAPLWFLFPLPDLMLQVWPNLRYQIP